MQKSYYYDIRDDIKKYPDAWCYIIFGGRNTGKTYSTLSYMLDEKEKFVYLKRTKEDMDVLCAGNSLTKKMSATVDLSPYKSINRDRKTNIKAFSVASGLGAFFNCNDENQPKGENIGYLMALSTSGKYKGMDLSECSYYVFDEFVPKMWDRLSRGEGESVLDLYKTIGRDREHRGLPPLKLIALANSDNCSSPLTNVLEITDAVAEMSLTKESCIYLKERGILIHRIIDNEEFMKKEAQSAIYKAMAGTAWGRMALENEFGFNDFSQIGKRSLKGFRPVAKYTYKGKMTYVYFNTEKKTYVVTRTQTRDSIELFNLDTESGQRHFWTVVGFTLLEAFEVNRVIFETYTMYDMIVRYKNYFKV